MCARSFVSTVKYFISRRIANLLKRSMESPAFRLIRPLPNEF